MDSRLRTNKHGWDNHQYIAMKLVKEQIAKNKAIDINYIAQQTGVNITEDEAKELYDTFTK